MDAAADEGDARHPETGRAALLRGWRYQFAVLLLAVLAGTLTWLARTVLYFPVDVQVTQAVQSVQAPWLVRLFETVAWIGFPPQSNVIFGLVIVGLFLVGLRLEAISTLFAAAGSAALWYWIAELVDRPRPSPELVHVAMQLPTGGFPSGHVLNLTAIFGFLIYLTVVLVPDLRIRVPIVSVLSVPILTIGVARVYDGAHWPSDVLGGYLIGAIWLALTIELYRWLCKRWRAAPSGAYSARRRPIRSP
ncbi:MAG: phosphatase PAP2 family protein [Chloroflexota bacterium]